MLIPLRTDRERSRPTRVVYALMAVNVALFLVQLLLQGTQGSAQQTPIEPLVLQSGSDGPWAYLTYAFLHGGFLHIGGNMLFLWVFGPPVEDRFGRWWFLAFYLLGAVIAGIAHDLVSASPVVGASGAIASVTGAFLILFPRTRIQVLWFFGIITTLLVPAWFMIGLSIARDLFSLAMPENGVANMAHLGGYIFGGGMSFALLASRVLPREQYDFFSVLKQSHRRRGFKAAAASRKADVSRLRKEAEPEPEQHDPVAEELANKRSEVSRALAEDRIDDAVEAYRELVGRCGRDRPAQATLSRRLQFLLGSALYERGEHDLADFAFSRYVDAFPEERDTPEVRVLLARIKARYRGEIDAAKALLENALRVLPEGDVKAAAQAELGRIHRGGAAGGAAL